MPKITLIILFFSLCLIGCSHTNKPVVWKSGHVVFADFEFFEIPPIINATGHTLMQDTLNFLHDSLKQEFMARNLQIIDSRRTANKALVVQTEILNYKFQYFAGPPPPTRNIIGQCILRTRLTQETTGVVVGEIITTNRVNVGRGMLEHKTPDAMLRRSAAQIASEVAKMR